MGACVEGGGRTENLRALGDDIDRLGGGRSSLRRTGSKPRMNLSNAAHQRMRERGDRLADDDDYNGQDENDQLLRERPAAGSANRQEVGVQPYVVGMFTLLGTGCLTPWNSLAGAVDFFGALLPHCDPADAFAVANFGANLLFLVIQLHFCKCFSARAVVGLIGKMASLSIYL